MVAMVAHFKDPEEGVYGGKIVETGRLDLKPTKECKFGLFLGNF